MKAAVTLAGVTKTFRRGGRIGRRGRIGGRRSVRALDNVTLSIPIGHVVTLVGPNGAGKSTLIRTIAGTITPDTGTVSLRVPVGVLFGNNFGLYDRLTAREYLEYIGRLRGFVAERLTDRVATVARQFELETFLDRRCGGFSSGMRQRTALAATLLHEPDLLLLDEPTTGLDIEVRRHVLSVIESVADGGRTIVVSTHHPEEIAHFSDETVTIDAGRIAEAGEDRGE